MRRLVLVLSGLSAVACATASEGPSASTAATAAAVTPPEGSSDRQSATASAITPPPSPPSAAATASAAPPAVATIGRDTAFERAARVASAHEWTTRVEDGTLIAVGQERADGGFRPALAVAYMAERDGVASDDADCRSLATITAAMRGATVEAAAGAAFGAARGCRIQIASRTTAQAAVQYALTSEEESISVLCSRDRGGDAAADAVCLEVVRAIWTP